MEQKNTKITIESGYGNVYTAEISRESTTDEMLETFIGLLQQLGYHPVSILRTLEEAVEDQKDLFMSISKSITE